MTAPNMAAITESLERSLRNCSINNTHRSGVVISEETGRSSSFSSSSNSPPSGAPESNHPHSSETTLELNSHLSLPYHWEQCLDLKTGDVYYVNWRNGMKAKEDPRTNKIMTEYNNGDSYSEYEEETSYDSEESSSESSPSPSSSRSRNKYGGDHVLIVAGCKSCLMYFMVPKQVADCPKCNGELLHFDR